LRWPRRAGAQVIVEGFKSYKEQIVTEAFSPKLNCIGARQSGRRF
jgi:structural maintenance of chromosome 3 (chondroitin sulfate proteoglycan 6)